MASAEALAALLTAGVGVLTAAGAAARFLWDKIERRFERIEADLAECRKREIDSQERRGVQLTVIELLWREVERALPDSPVLARAKHLLDDLKKRVREYE
jgi:hypothetical protein